MTEEFARGYLAALIAGEGCVCNKSGARHVEVANTEKEILETGLEACLVLGVEARIRGPYTSNSRSAKWNPIWYLIISRKDPLHKLATEVKLPKRKQDLLEGVLRSYIYRGTNTNGSPCLTGNEERVYMEGKKK